MAYELLEGTFNYNKTLIAPPGCRVLVHESTDKRRTQDPHGEHGWYIGIAPDHYRCHKVYIPKTRSERTAKTVKFYLHKTPLPTNSIKETILLAAKNLTEALRSHSNAPVIRNSKTTEELLKKLLDIFLEKAIICISQDTSPVKPKLLPSVKNKH